MAISVVSRSDHSVALSASEVTGALGDSITTLPIVVALSILTGISLSHVLLLFDVFQVVWGVRYGLALSVEPMKALCGLAIVGFVTNIGIAFLAGMAGYWLLHRVL